MTKPKSKSTKKTAKSKTAAKPVRPKRPKDQPLPGMSLPKDRAMDRICESIADAREQLNELRATEKGLLQNALTKMRSLSTTIYKAHGVELARVPGDEKVRVRLVDSDEGGDDVLDDGMAPEPDGEAGDVLDAAGE